ncbi:MAG: ATP-binding protein [Thermodesulfobacteriota bacterium]|nr:ATP-binding protein [Thermodesulfobacteriota bacterium]
MKQYRISIISFIMGAVILCVFSAFQKMLIGAPLGIKGFFVPFLFGGISGSLIGLWNLKLRQAVLKLQEANDYLEQRVEERTAELSKANEMLEREIREHKRAEEALWKSEMEKALILSSISEMVCYQTNELQLIWANRAASEAADLTPEKLEGRHCYEALQGRNAPCEGCPLVKAIETGEPQEAEIHFSDKKIRHVKGYPVIKNDGHVSGVVAISVDITDYKKMQEEILKARKLESLGTLAGGIAHDFNNLLSVIMGNISLAEDDIRPEIGSSKNLKEAEKASVLAKELTARLITFSRGGEPVKEVISIGDLVKNSVRSVLGGSDMDCQFSIPDDLLPAEIDEQQIKQVIRNIAINAREAVSTCADGAAGRAGEGTIKVLCEVVTIGEKDALPLKDGKYIKISLKDNGSGIPEENLKKIFDPYFSTKEMGTDKGQGLGLSVCHSIIQKHDGFVTVESESGKGATFSIYLPASERKIAKLEPAKKPVAERPVYGKGKILVMDDEEMVRNLSSQVLVRMGYDAEVCEDGSEAIQMYEKARESKEPFDAVILDLSNKFGMGGKEAMQRLLEIDPEVKGIVATGYSNDPVVTKFREYGFCGALAKPYTVDELSTILYDIISGEPYSMKDKVEISDI